MNRDFQNRISNFEGPMMSRKFPQFKLFRGDGSRSFTPSGCTYWGGKLTTNFDSSYSVAVVYPPNYPAAGEIRAYVAELAKHDDYIPHMYTDGHLCLYSNDHGGGGEGVGSETTAVTVVAWAAAWLNAYEVYKRSGSWPEKMRR